MEDILYTGSIPNITDLVNTRYFPAEAFVLFECFPQDIITEEQRPGLLQFAYLNDVAKGDINNSTSGRVFQQEFELRWEKDGNQYRITYLAEEPKHGLPGLTCNDTLLSGLEKHNGRKYYLFGTLFDASKAGRKDEDKYRYYAEVRIPRLLHYPTQKNAQRVQLTVCEYVDEKSGCIQLYRFQNLEPEQEEEK